MKSLPMLDTRFAEEIVRESVDQKKNVSTLRAEATTSHPKTRLSETGLPCSTEAELQSLRDDVLAVAEKYGYPVTPSRGAALSEFDREVTHVLVSHVDAPVNDARSTELWNFLTAVLLLDVACWRFPNTGDNPKFNRYLGASPKSTFKKLWWRGHVLGELSDRIGEDQSVALLERTSVAGDPRLPTSIIKQFIESTSEESSSKNLSDQFRSTMLVTKARLRTVCVEALDDDQLAELVGECVDTGLAR